MHDDWLVAIAFLTAGIGIACLLFAFTFLELPLSRIDEAHAAADGDPLRIRGVVGAVQQRGDLTIISVKQETSLEVVIFGNLTEYAAKQTDNKNTTLKAGDCVIIRGKRSSYQGKMQIAGTRVTRCTER